MNYTVSLDKKKKRMWRCTTVKTTTTTKKKDRIEPNRLETKKKKSGLDSDFHER